MRRVEVVDHVDRPVKILVFQDLDLLFCIPFTALSIVWLIVKRYAHKAALFVLRPCGRLIRRLNVSFTKLLVLFPLFVAAASGMTALGGPFSGLDLAGAVVVWLIGASVAAKIALQYYFIEDPNDETPPAAPMSKSEAATYQRIRIEAETLPDSCVASRLDKRVIYVGALRTMMILPALASVLILWKSWLNVALIAYLALFIYADFEHIEHIAAHSKRGRLLAERAPLTIRALEWLRRHVAWPVFGWYRDHYFVTHTLHHHVENNGPADWQSTKRYSQSSFLDFVKAVTWGGLNLVLPFETLYYLVQKRRFRILWIELSGLLLCCGLWAVVWFLEPVLFYILVANRLFAGCDLYAFVHRWHGFHRADRPYDVEASNQVLYHYVHHKRPRMHLWDRAAMRKYVAEIPPNSEVFLLRPEFFSVSGFWQLQSLLWRKELEQAGDALIEYRNVRPEDQRSPLALKRGLVGRGVGPGIVEAMVTAAVPNPRGALQKQWDGWLSQVAGRSLASILARSGKMGRRRQSVEEGIGPVA